MWFDLQGAFNQAAYSLDFFRRNIRRTPAPAYQGVDAGRRHNVQHPIEAAMDEHVIGKKREQELLLTVPPPMHGSILRKKYLESLARQGLGDHILVLMASVKRVPPGETRVSGEIGDFFVPQHQILPFRSRELVSAGKTGDRAEKDTTGPLVVIAATTLPSEVQGSQAFPAGLPLNEC
jgi:hypothetical protein